MERDENMFSNKIKAIERLPVSWNKDDVWQKVQGRISSTTQSHRSYLYAAAVMFIVLLSLPTRMDTPTVPAFEVSTNQSQTTLDPQPAMMIGEIESSKSIETAVNRKQIVLTELERLSIATNNQSDESQSNIAPILEDSFKADHEQLTITNTEVGIEERITPIVGVVTLSEKRNVSVKSKRRTLIHKLESPVQGPEVGLGNIIIARNK